MKPLFFVLVGEILVQMSDTQRHLNSDLEVVVSTGLRGHPLTSLLREDFLRP